MTNLIYSPIRTLQSLKKLGLVDSTNIEAAMELSTDQARETADYWPKGEGFGSSDHFAEVISVARDLGFRYDGKTFTKM